MGIQRMDHVGVIVSDLEAAIEFFVELGLERGGAWTVEGELVDRVIGLQGVRSEIVFLRTPDGHSQIELSKVQAPPGPSADPELPANAAGIRHLCFAVDDVKATLARLRARGYGLVGELVNYEDSYWLCYIRGPDGIIVELAEKIGDPVHISARSAA